MSISYLNEKIKYESVSPKEGVLVIEDLKEGVGTTYGTALRRSILHSDNGYDVIGICVNGGKATNIFGSIDGMKNTVLDMCKYIKKAKYNIKENSDKLIEIGFSGNVSELRLKDLITSEVTVENGDQVICSFTREVPIDIRILLNSEIGASSSQFNKEIIKNYSGDESNWIVLDSCHGDIVTVSFSSEVELGLETIKLRVLTKSKKPIDCITTAIEDLTGNFNNISNYLAKFK